MEVKHTGSGKIKVLHLIYTMAYGGIETSLINWIINCDKSRFDVQLACFETPDGDEAPFVTAAERHGLEMHTIPWARRKPLIKSSRALIALLRKLDTNILHLHNIYANLVGAIAARFTPVKTMTTLYVWDKDVDLKRTLLRDIDKLAIRFLDRITTHCDETRKETIRLGFAEEKVTTLISGFVSNCYEITAEERAQWRMERGVSDEHVVLANVSRFYPEKEQAMLLHAFANVSKQHPNLRLWMLGIGPLEEEIRSLCTSLGLDDKVDFLGFVSDLPPLLAQVDIQVHPSILEGVPLSICQGMAAGLPIVASRVGGIPEVIHHEETGLLVEKRDQDGFEKALNRLLNDGDLRGRIGSNARHFIENDYSLEHAVEELEKYYLQMVEQLR
jgi:glycosyltransferase involved in cell wall biosynthesis